MAKKIEDLTLSNLGNLAGEGHGEFLSKDMFVAMSARNFGRRFLHTKQPYRVDDARVIRVVSGFAHCVVNMEPHDLNEGTILVVPPRSVFEIEFMDESFDLQTFSFRDLPNEFSVKACMFFELDSDTFQLSGEYFDLIWHTISRRPLLVEAIRKLQMAFLTELLSLYNSENSSNNRKPHNRQEDIFHRFLALVNKHAHKEHSIAFYADKLCLTPNHLGAVVRSVSGQTVMQWIHHYIVQQAKLKLKYSDIPVGEIAEELNFPTASFFSKFFKRETGITPGNYRNN